VTARRSSIRVGGDPIAVLLLVAAPWSSNPMLLLDSGKVVVKMASLLDSAETRRRGSRGAAARGPSCDDSCPNPDSIVQARVYEGRGSTSTTRQRQYVLLNNLNVRSDCHTLNSR
jgi:hypothetical protein